MLEKIIRKYYDAIFDYCYHSVGNRSAAEDLCQLAKYRVKKGLELLAAMDTEVGDETKRDVGNTRYFGWYRPVYFKGKTVMDTVRNTIAVGFYLWFVVVICTSCVFSAE